jgi:hypothetical protein
MPDRADSFTPWLLRRVARAAKAGDLSADLLTDLQVEIAEPHERIREERYAFAAQELAERLDLSVGRLTELLAAVESHPRVI